MGRHRHGAGACARHSRPILRVNQVLYVQDTPPDLTPDAAAEWKATRDGLVRAEIPGTGRAVASGLPELMPEDVAADLAASGVTALGGIPTALMALKRTHAGVGQRRNGYETSRRASAQVTAGEWLAEHEGKDLWLAVRRRRCHCGHAVTTAAEAVGGRGQARWLHRSP